MSQLSKQKIIQYEISMKHISEFKHQANFYSKHLSWLLEEGFQLRVLIFYCLDIAVRCAAQGLLYPHLCGQPPLHLVWPLWHNIIRQSPGKIKYINKIIFHYHLLLILHAKNNWTITQVLQHMSTNTDWYLSLLLVILPF